MANGNGEQMKRAAFGVLRLLRERLPSYCTLSINQETDFVLHALERHAKHLSTHTIDQTHLDPFKLICWIGCEIIDGLEKIDFSQSETVLEALIDCLEEVLMLETNNEVLLLQDDRELLKRLLLEEIKKNGDHGIGFNGLFVAFHCLRSTYKQLKGS